MGLCYGCPWASGDDPPPKPPRNKDDPGSALTLRGLSDCVESNMSEVTTRALRILTASGAITNPENPTKDLLPVVYAFKIGRYIKIGHSTNLARRRAQLGAEWSDLLACERGTIEDERAIHRTLKGHRGKAQEFYDPTYYVVHAVNAMRVATGLPEIPTLRPRKFYAA